MADAFGERANRSVSTVVGIALMILIVIILAALVSTMAFGLSGRLNEEAMVHDEEACPGFQ